MPAILALEMIPQKQVEPGKGRVLRRPHILLERDHGGQLHREIGTVHFALIFLNDVNPIQKHGLDRILPRPERKRVITQRGIVRIQHERRAALGMADEVRVIHLRSSPLFWRYTHYFAV